MDKLPILVLTAISLLSGCAQKSEKDFVEVFMQNIAAYESLLEMYSECVSTESSFVWALDKNDSGAECRAILKRTKLSGIHFSNEGVYTLYSLSNGFGPGEVDYVYSEKRLEPLFNSLEEAASTVQPYELGYVEVGNNWYLSYQCLCG